MNVIKKQVLMIELNKVYNSDCLEFMAGLESGFFDYSLTSPPYNIGVSKTNIHKNKYEEFKDSAVDYFEEQKEVVSELLRVTKKHVFYNIQMVSGNKPDLLKLIGFFSNNIKEILIWDKGFGQPAISPNVFNSAFEFIIIFSNDCADKRAFKDANFDRGTQSNVFRIKNRHYNNYSEQHKAVFPLDLPRYFIRNFGKEKDIWYDPYFGTGTTGLACSMEKRNYVGTDISGSYCRIATDRIGNYNSQLTLL